MKKSFLLLFAGTTLFMNSCVISDKQDSSMDLDATVIDPENPPVMTFDEPVHDFGKMAVGTSLEYSYKFTNTGTGPLVIHDIKTSCGCTALKNWPKGVINPGETGEIPIEFKPTIGGPVSKTISIVTNATPSVQKLTLKGEVAG